MECAKVFAMDVAVQRLMGATPIDSILHEAEVSRVARKLLSLLKIVLDVIKVMNRSLIILCYRIHLFHRTFLLR